MSANLKPDMILGNKNAKHVIKIEYDGGEDYTQQVLNAIDKLKQRFGDIFQYNLYKDKSFSGRLEMTLFWNTKIDHGEGFLIFSKQASKKFPHQDYSSLMDQVDSVIRMEAPII